METFASIQSLLRPILKITIGKLKFKQAYNKLHYRSVIVSCVLQSNSKDRKMCTLDKHLVAIAYYRTEGNFR